MANLQKQHSLRESECLRRFRLGDEEAFEEMFFDYYPKLFWFVERHVMSRDAADEIVKDLFVDLWQQRERLAIRSSLKAYLYAAARNRALNFLRMSESRKRHLTVHVLEDEEWALIPSLTDDPLEELEKKELEAEVQKAIEALPGRCKLVLTLRWDDGLRYAEIAEVLGISVKTVENQMARAFGLLCDRLSPFIPIFLLPAISPFFSVT
jgi:RNA polymerase sigma-70 factor (ECF subfamily)